MAELTQSMSHIALAEGASNPQPEYHGVVLGASSGSCAAAERGSSCSEPLPGSSDTEEASWCCEAPAGLWPDGMLVHPAQRLCLAYSQRMVSLGPSAPPTLQEVGEAACGSMLAAEDSHAQAARPEADLLHALAVALQVGQLKQV